MLQKFHGYRSNPYVGNLHNFAPVKRGNALRDHLHSLTVDDLEEIVTALGIDIEQLVGKPYQFGELVRALVDYVERNQLLPELFYEIGWRDMQTYTECIKELGEGCFTSVCQRCDHTFETHVDADWSKAIFPFLVLAKQGQSLSKVMPMFFQQDNQVFYTDGLRQRTVAYLKQNYVFKGRRRF